MRKSTAGELQKSEAAKVGSNLISENFLFCLEFENVSLGLVEVGRNDVKGFVLQRSLWIQTTLLPESTASSKLSTGPQNMCLVHAY